MIVCAAGPLMILTSDDLGYAQNTKTQNGLNFQVPDDWPIEKRGGIVAPIPTEEYVLIKFKEVEEEFRAVKADLTGKFEELQLSIKNMESGLAKDTAEAQSQTEFQAAPVTPPPDQTGIMESLSSLQKEMARLDRKITNKAMEMMAGDEEIRAQIKSVEKKIETLLAHVQKIYKEIGYTDNK